MVHYKGEKYRESWFSSIYYGLAVKWLGLFLSGKRLDARKDSDIFVYIHDICILNQSNSPIESVSLGPGDPELLTLKGLHIFQGADKIDFLALPPPSSTSAISLRGEKMLRVLGIEEDKFMPFGLPMSKDCKMALAVYDEVYQVCYELIQSQPDTRVVIVVEGNGSILASTA